jgi:hypothetical protein
MQRITNIYCSLRTAKTKRGAWWTFESRIYATTQTQAGLIETNHQDHSQQARKK